jgi:DnaK suppressor protein
MASHRPLDAQAMSEARELLQRKHGELRESVRMLVYERRSEPVPTADPLVSAANTLDDGIRIALLDRRNQQRLQIEAALERLERGAYGRCRDCDEFIGVPRLRALPFAQRCSACQARVEELASRRARAEAAGISPA